MKDISNIEELLNGYVDGELTLRERTKVRRMADNDPKVAQRLEALRKGKSLLNSLPVEPAPEQILPNVMTKMRVEQPIEQEPAIVDFESVRRNVRSQRLSALAASIVFIAVLSMVINAINQQQQITPQPNDGYVANPGVNNVVANEGFSGRLEMKTKDIAGFEGFLNWAMENNALSDSFALLSRADGTRVYQLSCSKELLSEVMTDLNAYWNRLDSATLSVDTGTFGQQVAVNTVTTDQIKQIVSQKDMSKSIEVAGNFAVINDMAQCMPGNEILSAMEMKTEDFPTVSIPQLAQDINNTHENLTAEAEQEKTVQLTIVLTR